MTVLLAAVGLLAAALWSRHTVASGEWRGDLVGMQIDTLMLKDAVGKALHVTHPAILYFFDPACPPCVSARSRFNRHWKAQRLTRVVPAYAVLLASHETLVRERANFVDGVAVGRLVQREPSLAFVRDVPMLVRTDASGRILAAFVGLPSSDVLRVLR